jgi:hypothetical protein
MLRIVRAAGPPHSFKNESGRPAKMLVSVAPRYGIEILLPP